MEEGGKGEWFPFRQAGEEPEHRPGGPVREPGDPRRIVLTSHIAGANPVPHRAKAFPWGKVAAAGGRMKGPSGCPMPHTGEGAPTGASSPFSSFYVVFSTRATAWAAMPEPSPVKPRPSSVVALTLICSASTPSAAAMFRSISRR